MLKRRDKMEKLRKTQREEDGKVICWEKYCVCASWVLYQGSK
jgi:hypothetical protein